MGDSVEDRSKLLFNNIHVLSVAGAIAAGEELMDSKSLQNQLGLGQSSVHRVLKVLEGVGLVERVERGARTEPLRYRRASHSFWLAATELLDA